MPPLTKNNKTSITKKEWRRLCDLMIDENEARQQGYKQIAGVDEAGRGPLAGPVVAAACIIPEGVFFKGINDSKQLTAEEREALFIEIVPSTVYAVGIISPEEIDRINIYQATIRAMLQAIVALSVVPDMLLVDGMALPHPTVPSKKIIGGDAKSQLIAAASIVAKVTRDRMMVEYDAKYPQYGFKQHKGYGTPQHLEAIDKHGPCPIHRMSYEPLHKFVQYELF